MKSLIAIAVVAVVAAALLLWLPNDDEAGRAAQETAAARQEPQTSRQEPATSRDAASLFAPVPEGTPRYDAEYPSIGYSTTARTDKVAQLEARLAAGELVLEQDPQRGYLDSLLDALDIDPASQVLVFSTTSLQTGSIRPRTPRAIYFNDDVYVAWVQGGGPIEIASMDPFLGPVFYTLEQSAEPALEQQTGRCLRCHDSLSLTGGGVPRFIVGSGYIDTLGNIAAHEGWIVTTQRTPLKNRWGGWYVTGQHGEQVHLGNIIVRNVADLSRLEDLRVHNLESLEGVVDMTPYAAPGSDIVALLVMQHQVDVQNEISRVGYKVRAALHQRELALAAEATAAETPDASDAAATAPGATATAADATAAANEATTAAGAEPDPASADAETDPAAIDDTPSRAALPDIPALVAELAEPLVEAMLFVDAAPLGDRIEGSSTFRETFEARGPFDDAGRSLRALDLETRLSRYPLSWIVYSEAFDGLPELVRDHVYRRFADVLTGADRDSKFAHLSDEDRSAILEILAATKPEFAAALSARERANPSPNG